MKRHQNSHETRHLLQPEDEVFEEGLMLKPLSPIKSDRPSRRSHDRSFPEEEEPKKRRRRGRRRSGKYRVLLPNFASLLSSFCRILFRFFRL
ncbi:hypothetical protein GCK32_021044 [Trichostrongylus colubriformis]|uniref:Uncharacterized protein n=1 Tax=Trichostrongylus colubriformis TaxID=6319 RepID=A0AAN8FLR3_TRICO